MSGYNYKFIPKQGYSYQISGWMKGENIAQNVACKLRIDFYTANNNVMTRNKAYLATVLQEFINCGLKLKKHLFIWENLAWVFIVFKITKEDFNL